MSRTTIRDVAKRAGVGIGTVSRVLNNSPQVSEATQARVLEAINELDFKPSHVARQLPRKTKLHNIGVITHSWFSYDSFTARLRGVQSGLLELDEPYELILYNVSSLENYDERLQTITAAGPVEGLLVIDLDLTEDHRSLLDRNGIPYVGLNERQKREWPGIGCNNRIGSYMATQHLIDLGHHRIAYIGDEFYDHYGFFTSRERFEGYEKALHDAEIPLSDEYVCLGPFGDDTARQLAADLLSLPEPPTAIFAMSDTQALGCITAAREAGFSVPDDLSVIGYDNLNIALHANLTTIDQHLERGGLYGVRYLMALIHKEPHPVKPALPPLRLIQRGTTKAIST